MSVGALVDYYPISFFIYLNFNIIKFPISVFDHRSSVDGGWEAGMGT